MLVGKAKEKIEIKEDSDKEEINKKIIENKMKMIEEEVNEGLSDNPINNNYYSKEKNQ